MAVNFFKDQKKGSEIQDWKQELLSPKEEKKKEAVKKVIAAMTIGKDVSVLFTDVLNCMQTHNIELKKLVYLYVMNYAKTQPEKAILAVNTFQKDSSDPNPLIRALAIRTMGCIRLEKISEYLCDPLKACLRDPDPYVRKTAAICVAKLYDISAELVEDRGFLEMLNELISDSNPMVVANAVAALSEIDEVSEKQVFSIDQSNLNKLLLALDVCTEWGQIFILSSLAKYTAHDAREAENICDRVVPRLNHTNAAVVLNTVKVLMVNMEYLENPAPLIAKIGPPLITLLSKEPEIQYVALRNINIILQRQPQILQHEMKIFFCKYNDPIYVKMEKLEIMIMLAQDRNVEQVLAELREYATEVDVDFVRKSVRAIGRCAIKLANAAEKCIQTLLDLIQTKVNYVVQEAIVVIKDIFRKYPNQYESIIGTLCENLETLDEPEAKASLIWIIGEYAERINNADQLLESFLESFADESATVQLQLLTATVKLFLKRPRDTQEMVQKVLNTATQESDNPDLRDRGFIYWRLLSTDPEAAKAVVLSEKPLISDNISTLEDSLLEVLVRNISTLSSVYHRPPEAFVAKMKQFTVYGGRGAEKRKKREDNEEEDEEGERVAVGGDSNNAPAGSGNLLDLDEPAPATPSGGARNLLDDEADFFGAGPSAAAAAAAPSPIPKAVVLQAQQGEGMQVAAVFVRKSGQPHLDLSVTNNSPAPISGIAVQFNKNSSQLAPASQPNMPPIAPGATASCLVPLSLQGPRSDTLTPQIQVAIKNNVKVFYFVINLNLNALFSEDGALARDEYLGMWRSIPDASEKSWVVKSALTPDQMAAKLKQFNIFEIARRQVETASVLYLSLKVEPDRTALLLELTFNNQGAIKIAVRTSQPDWIPIFGHTFNQLIA